MSTYFDEFILERDVLKLKEYFKRRDMIFTRCEEILKILQKHRGGVMCEVIDDVALDPDDKLGETVLVCVRYYGEPGEPMEETGYTFPLEYLTKTDPEIEADEEHYAHLREEAKKKGDL